METLYMLTNITAMLKPKLKVLLPALMLIDAATVLDNVLNGEGPRPNSATVEKDGDSE